MDGTGDGVVGGNSRRREVNRKEKALTRRKNSASRRRAQNSREEAKKWKRNKKRKEMGGVLLTCDAAEESQSGRVAAVLVDHAASGRLRHRDGQSDGFVEFATSRLHRHDGRHGHSVAQKFDDQIRLDGLSLREMEARVSCYVNTQPAPASARRSEPTQHGSLPIRIRTSADCAYRPARTTTGGWRLTSDSC